MPFIFIGSTGDGAGHSLVTWAFGRRLMEKGLKVGFLKPFGSHPIHKQDLLTDHDAFLFKETFGLQESCDRICPYPVFEEAWRHKTTDEILEELKSLTNELGEGKDVLLIMGSKQIFFDDAPFPLPEISIIPKLDTDVILISRFREVSKSIYSILSLASLLKGNIKGIVLNRIPSDRLEEVKTRLVPSLIQKGVPLTAALPEDPFLSYRNLWEIIDVLRGEILRGEKNLENPVGGMTVGSADLTGPLKIFKRVYNKIILLKASLPGKALVDISGPRPVGGILLTGGRNPAPQLLQAASQAAVPLIRIKEDTFSALERLNRTPPYLSPGDEAKVRHFTDLLDRDGSLDNLIKSLKLI